jgi:hypothetical protein
VTAKWARGKGKRKILVRRKLKETKLTSGYFPSLSKLDTGDLGRNMVHYPVFMSTQIKIAELDSIAITLRMYFL